MAAAGLRPHPESILSKRVSPERLAEFDRLMEAGGIEAIIRAVGSEPVDADAQRWRGY